MIAQAQAQLFSDELTFEAPSTEGIKYAGSKLKLIPHILRLAGKVNAKTFLDGFSGTTRVSQAFAQSGYDVVCNDHAVWSEVFGTCYLKAKSQREYRALIEHLNGLKPKDGWFTEFYGGDADQQEQPKRPWQVQNTRKLDAIREEIERLALDPVSKCVALTSLILALDQVDSTLGHFVSYLREWSPRSYKTLLLRFTASSGQIFLRWSVIYKRTLRTTTRLMVQTMRKCRRRVCGTRRTITCGQPFASMTGPPSSVR